jgi:hypothetical protein
MSKLSPINTMIARNNLTVNTSSLLSKYSQNQSAVGEDHVMKDASQENEVDEDKINSITIS